MKFSRVLDPLAMKENVAQFLASLQQPSESDASMGRTNLVMSQVTANAAYTPAGTMDMPPPAEEGPHEDIHQYQFKDIAIKQGDRAYLPLLDLQVPFSNLYRWDVRDFHENTYRWYEPREDEQAQQAEDIWHAVRLKIPARSPGPPRPVMVTDGDLFLGRTSSLHLHRGELAGQHHQSGGCES